MQNYLKLLTSKTSLTQEETETAMDFILTKADTHQAAAFLAILKYRGETVDEIQGMVSALRKKTIFANFPFPVLDIVGTGGDLANTVNISTGAAILSAACGIPIAKHGNRSVSSLCGSADVLEALGIAIEISHESLLKSLEKVNIAFLYAPYYLSGLKQLSVTRRALKFPTAINLLGPLLNPAKAQYSLIGVSSEEALELISQVIMKDESKKRTLVFYGNGLDELTPLGTILAYDISDGKRIRLEINPRTLGFAQCTLEDLKGGDAKVNASILNEVFAGKQNAIADALVFSAGTALWIFGKVQTLEEGILLAKKVQKEGGAAKTLAKWRSFCDSINPKMQISGGDL